jgi:4-hydroxy-tetrahydrodipicolinate synthase
LFDLAVEGKKEAAFEIYRWFLPLLRIDTVPKFVQLIKLVQEELGVGSARVRPPRLKIEGGELAEAKELITNAMRYRPDSLSGSSPLL